MPKVINGNHDENEPRKANGCPSRHGLQYLISLCTLSEVRTDDEGPELATHERKKQNCCCLRCLREILNNLPAKLFLYFLRCGQTLSSPSSNDKRTKAGTMTHLRIVASLSVAPLGLQVASNPFRPHHICPAHGGPQLSFIVAAPGCVSGDYYAGCGRERQGKKRAFGMRSAEYGMRNEEAGIRLAPTFFPSYLQPCAAWLILPSYVLTFSRSGLLPVHSWKSAFICGCIFSAAQRLRVR